MVYWMVEGQASTIVRVDQLPLLRKPLALFTKRNALSLMCIQTLVRLITCKQEVLIDSIINRFRIKEAYGIKDFYSYG